MSESGGFWGSDSADVGLEPHYYVVEEKKISISDKQDPQIKPAVCAICGSYVETNTCVRSINT